MKKIKILNVVGARPNFIKISPLVKEFKKYPRIEAKLIHTGQHYDANMSDYFFSNLDIPKPDYNLGIGSASHAVQTAKIMIEFEKVCLKEKPDLVLVVGDVNSTVACSLVAVKLSIKVAHVEAGLRSFDRTMPEEINRVVCDRISYFLFCPTKTAVSNLKKEGIVKNVFYVGDVMCDMLLSNLNKIEKAREIQSKFKIPRDYFVATIHRPSNTDNKQNLRAIIQAFAKIKYLIILPLHPRTRKMLKKFGLYDIALNMPNLKIINPISYLEMLYLEKNAKLIITDSGGVQKEAYILRKPCITLRENTEWVETIGVGNVLLAEELFKLPKLVKDMLAKKFAFQTEYYGKGKAAERIGQILIKH